MITLANPGTVNGDGHSRAAWLKARRTVIGSSDIAALAGLNDYATALDVYLDKIEGREVEETQAMKMGKLLEPVILDLASEELRTAVVPNAVLMTHPDVPYFGCTPDGLLYDYVIDGEGGGDLVIVEAKSTSMDVDEPSRAHVVQLTWQIGCTGASYGFLAYLVRGRDFKMFRIERDQELIDALFEIGHDFHDQHLAPKIPPAPHTIGDVVKLFPRHIDGKVIEAAPEVAELIATIRHADEQASYWAAQKEEAKSQLIAVMGDAEAITVNGATAITYRAAKDSTTIDTKALAAAWPDIAKTFTVPKPGSRRFLLK